MSIYPFRLLLPLSLLCASLWAAPATTLTIGSSDAGRPINPAMWGLFFEDINFGADGGLYAELIKNGSFEFPDPRMGWLRVGSPAARDAISYVARSDSTPANTRLVEVQVEKSVPLSLENEGFRGIGLHAGEAYDFSAELCALAPGLKVRVDLLDAQNAVLATGELLVEEGAWSKARLSLNPARTESKAKLRLTVAGSGVLQLDRVSLFPRHTWKGRPQGLRADMVEALAAMKPGFLRFPGGCIVEGYNLGLRYQWKKTIGPREERALLLNRWNTEFKDRAAPDYYQSFGLGFFEYFQLCEDLGAEALPILNCGMACQYNSGELVALADLQPYIQDALDLVEFATGSVDSEWGAKRAAMGHPAPFSLRYLGVGNEQWGPQYVERFALFAEALKARYPELQLVAAAGPSPADERFDYLWGEWRKRNVDLVDEHSYNSPQWFVEAFHRYDNYDRRGPKVFVGEYACHTKDRRNNVEAALAEAVFMLGLERNADVVRLAAYAPLFAHSEAWQWKPDMIWVDNLRVVQTPNYYVQKLFATNRGDMALPVSVTGEGAGKLYASVAQDKRSGELILKVVNLGDEAVETALVCPGSSAASTPIQRITLGACSPEAENTFDDPDRVVPVLSEEASADVVKFPAHSLSVLRMKWGQ